MQTWFENTIDKKLLYSGGAYALTARTDCASESVDFMVYNPLERDRVYDDFKEARDYYLSLGNPLSNNEGTGHSSI